MRSFGGVCFGVLLVLAGCDSRPGSVSDPAAFIGQLMEAEGPQVSGVNATVLESAKQAEEKRQWGRAVQFYQQLLDKEPDNAVFIVGMADNLRRLRQLDEALRYYQKILTKEPENLDALEGKGICLLNKGDTTLASDALNKVLAKDVTRWRTLNAVGVLFVLKNKPQEGQTYFEEALKVAPNEIAVLNNLGLVYALLQDYDKAVEVLDKASSQLSEKDPEKKRADMNLALTYGLSGDMERAEEIARRHLRESALNNNLGFYAYLADNRELAKAYLNNAVSGSPVFYEKAWHNLEVITGAKMDNDVMRKRHNSPLAARARSGDAPFSVDEDDSATAAATPPVAAPVVAVQSSPPAEAVAKPQPQFQAGLQPQPKPQAQPVAEKPVALPAALPAQPQAQLQPLKQEVAPLAAQPRQAEKVRISPPAAQESSAVEVFPAVPVEPQMQGKIIPVAMQQEVKEEVVESAIPLRGTREEVKKKLESGDIDSIFPPESMPDEMGTGVLPTAKKHSRSDMIVFQADQEKAAAEAAAQQQEAAIEEEEKPVKKMKKKKSKPPVAAEETQEAPTATPAAVEEAAPAPATSQPQPDVTEPVIERPDRQSTLDAIRQIF